MALRRESTPYMPRAKRMLPRTRKWRRPGMRNSMVHQSSRAITMAPISATVSSSEAISNGST